ncbi:MAG: Fe(3+) ABC transporter substrate-binding protein [Alphaproteobacteria bacterium]|jgi:iron(III) transport system substrate-binding protein|nr:Fe(3+) ABC transporter substrate-binding protein [Alphaproteobacteria bacterium]MDP6564054.1 Fe(3+) ABC transporter substrate-binding protein [Alphaproteobacteria bacterium]MDP6816059.1 Fe(3+) ABC transporter substrate-binding protein [Alphaproteobacteria bacterium]
MSRKRHPLVLPTVALFALATLPADTAMAESKEVNVYSYRQEFLIRPFLDTFTDQTGIKVNVVFAKKGIIERLKAEGANSPADLVLTVDISRLDRLVRAGLVRKVASPLLEANVPPQYRHPEGLWFGLTTRARILYVSKDRVKPGAIGRYEDLADEKWRGRVCMRSSKHVYNRALMASMIAAHGESGAEAWARGLKANMARKPQGNDRGQVKAIKEGLCDVGLGNSYYYGKMKFNRKKPEQRQWAAAVNLVFPNQGDRGTHVNVSGVAMTKAAKRPAAAQKLMEFLAGDLAQRMYAKVNYEYPVKPGMAADAEVASWGDFKSDPLPLQTIADLSPQAVAVFQRVGLP